MLRFFTLVGAGLARSTAPDPVLMRGISHRLAGQVISGDGTTGVPRPDGGAFDSLSARNGH